MLQKFKFFQNNTHNIHVFGDNEWDDAAVYLLSFQLEHNVPVTDGYRIWTDNLTLHNNKLEIISVQNYLHHCEIYYRVQDLITTRRSLHTVEIEYRTLNRLIDDARV